MDGGELSQPILTEEQAYNVKISGHVTGGAHRGFAMASEREYPDAEFLAFNEGWMAAVLPYLCDGGVCGTFIRLARLSDCTRCGLQTSACPLKPHPRLGEDQRRQRSLYRSQHGLLPLFKKGSASHVNNVELGKKGPAGARTCGPIQGPRRSLRRPPRPPGPSDRQADSDAGGRAPRSHQPRRLRARSVPSALVRLSSPQRTPAASAAASSSIRSMST